MPARIAYMVTALLPDEATALEYIAWLEDGHLDKVIEGGAHSAMIVRLDGDSGGGGGSGGSGGARVETHYVFATRELFDRYVEKTAPILRAEGLRQFPPERGVRFERRLGVIL